MLCHFAILVCLIGGKQLSSQSLKRDEIIDFILDLFARRGAEEYMGEPVSMAQHMEQSAACAVADGASDELVVAALLHDIGHFVGDSPIDALENGIFENCR